MTWLVFCCWSGLKKEESWRYPIPFANALFKCGAFDFCTAKDNLEWRNVWRWAENQFGAHFNKHVEIWRKTNVPRRETIYGGQFFWTKRQVWGEWIVFQKLWNKWGFWKRSAYRGSWGPRQTSRSEFKDTLMTQRSRLMLVFAWRGAG